MPCPFGFQGEHPEITELHQTDQDIKQTQIKGQPASTCPFTKPSHDERFNYEKDPISWFYQNQIKSEEQFQEKKAELRETARHKLDDIFEKKGKHLIIDSEDDDFSIASSELSAWDSDVHSIQTLASCANSWAEAAQFKAPAMVTLRVVLIVTMLAAVHSAWNSLQAIMQINRFWGIIVFGWVPPASLAAAVMTGAATGTFWYMSYTREKKGLIGAQIAMHLLVAACSMLAMVCWVYPLKIDSELKSSVCRAGDNDPDSRLCKYLPMIQEQVNIAMRRIMSGNTVLSVLALAATCVGTWHFWELSYVEKKASKYKRRRRQRKNQIPWDKIKVENMGPVSYCGGPPPRAPTAAPTASSTAQDKKVV